MFPAYTATIRVDVRAARAQPRPFRLTYRRRCQTKEESHERHLGHEHRQDRNPAYPGGDGFRAPFLVQYSRSSGDGSRACSLASARFLELSPEALIILSGRYTQKAAARAKPATSLTLTSGLTPSPRRKVASHGGGGCGGGGRLPRAAQHMLTTPVGVRTRQRQREHMSGRDQPG